MTDRQIIQLRRLQEKAWSIFHSALKRKIIERSLHCQHCGVISKTEAHHTDYNKPLDVQWLCRKCHREVHKDRLKGKYKTIKSNF